VVKSAPKIRLAFGSKDSTFSAQSQEVQKKNAQKAEISPILNKILNQTDSKNAQQPQQRQNPTPKL